MDFHERDDADWAIKVTGLSKRYGGRVVLKGLDLRVPRGGVHGLLGPNGSGKTTSLRIMLGLARANEGTVHILGYPSPAQLPQVISRVGAIVESPKLAPRLTARRNLETLALSIGESRRRVHEVLLEVGLADEADQNFATYSLGMKQRLAIAATLLKKPEVLIFDEPTNGLDPVGIHDIRAVLRRLAESGRTVLVSSHLLSEMEQVADSVSIIARGRLVTEGLMRDLLADGDGEVCVGIADRAGAAEVLRRAGWEVRDEAERIAVTGKDGPPKAEQVAQTLGEAGLWPHELVTRSSSLERVFLELTREAELREGAA